MNSTGQGGAGDDKYGHRGMGGFWSPYVGPCICEVCKEERAAAHRRAALTPDQEPSR